MAKAKKNKEFTKEDAIREDKRLREQGEVKPFNLASMIKIAFNIPINKKANEKKK